MDERRRHDRYRIATLPFTTSTSTERPWATWPASSWNRSRAGAGRSCRPTTSSPSCASTATKRASYSWPTRCSPAGAGRASGCAWSIGTSLPDVVTLGKGFGNGFPVTCVAVREAHKESFEKISASSSYGGNPMACAAALASTEVIQEENLLDYCLALGEHCTKILEEMKERHPIIGDVRCKGALMGIELVKDRQTKEPFTEAGEFVYQARLPQTAWPGSRPGHILRMSPLLSLWTSTRRPRGWRLSKKRSEPRRRPCSRPLVKPLTLSRR